MQQIMTLSKNGNTLVTKVNDINTSAFVLKSKYDRYKIQKRKSVMQKNKTLTLADLLKKQTIMLKLLKQK